MRIPDSKAAVDKEWEKLEKLPAWKMTKVRSKREVIIILVYALFVRGVYLERRDIMVADSEEL